MLVQYVKLSICPAVAIIRNILAMTTIMYWSPDHNDCLCHQCNNCSLSITTGGKLMEAGDPETFSLGESML